MTQRTCSVEGCSNPHKARGYCLMHYQRFMKHGDPLAVLIKLPPRAPRPQRLCTVAGCVRRHDANGYCNMHRLRLYHHDDLNVLNVVRPNGMFKGDVIAYATAHRRKRARDGAASAHACVMCGELAYDWSYVGGCPRERVDARGRRYSPDPDMYQALCRKCHRRYDGAGKP